MSDDDGVRRVRKRVPRVPVHRVVPPCACPWCWARYFDNPDPWWDETRGR